MVVFPALSRPKTSILASLSPNMDIKRDTQMPMLSKRPGQIATWLIPPSSCSTLPSNTVNLEGVIHSALWCYPTKPTFPSGPLWPVLPLLTQAQVSRKGRICSCSALLTIASATTPSVPSVGAIQSSPAHDADHVHGLCSAFRNAEIASTQPVKAYT